jgi:two-component system, OmpR family, sensor kinase
VAFAGVQRVTARWFTGWTLRARLLAALIALLALICVIVGGVTQLIAHRYLVNQLDTRLGGIAYHAIHSPAPAVQPDGSGMPSYMSQGPGTAGLVVASDGKVTGHIAGDSGDQVLTTKAQATKLRSVPADGHVHAVSLPGAGDFRAIAVTVYGDKGAEKVVIGLPLAGINRTLVGLGLTELCVMVAGLIAVGLVGETIIRRALRPLNRVATIATRVSEMELDRGEVALKIRVPARDTDPRTEIGQVGSALNRMLLHVSNALAARQASEVRIRKFVADASHELRTPLAAIRGYAELTRRVNDGSVSPDVAYAMKRVESESARMTTLVEDLLLLARLDAGRPLDRSAVDLSMLVVDVVSDAHVAGRDHEWSLELPDEAVTIVGDRPRLHQVVANLLTNARMHTPAGTKVTLALVAEPAGGATISVTDNGPGIAPALIPDIFERFARGDSSRSRAAGSTGLGLAIVAAVVDAHGGTVTVSSRPGETAFTVVLPPEAPLDGPAAADDDAEVPPAMAIRELDVSSSA